MELIVDALNFHKAFLKCRRCENPKAEVSESCLQWSPPPPDFTKVNLDDAISSSRKDAGVGIIA